MAFLGPAAAGLPRQVLPVSSIAALATLGIVNAGRRLLAVLPADRRGRAATASVITYVMPVVALVLGVSLCGERLTAGLILIALDAWLGTSRHPR